ncbi:hypothetical protein COSO111634_24315 [Corallococcus soli]
MPWAVHIPEELCSRLEALPLRPRLAVRLRLLRLAEAAEQWLPEDPRWRRVARPDVEGWRFYTEGCCVRVHQDKEGERLTVHSLGRVLIHDASTSREVVRILVFQRPIHDGGD